MDSISITKSHCSALLIIWTSISIITFFWPLSGIVFSVLLFSGLVLTINRVWSLFDKLAETLPIDPHHPDILRIRMEVSTDCRRKANLEHIKFLNDNKSIFIGNTDENPFS